MVKIMSLMKRKEGVSLDEFRNWAMNEHPAFGLKLPGIKNYRMNVVMQDDPALPYDAVSEFCFDTMDAFQSAFASDEGKAAAGDAIAHCSLRTRLVAEEKLLKE